MFSQISSKGFPTTDTYFCLSTDTKDETGKGNGDVLVEIDPFTGDGKVYFFNADGAEGSRWLPWEEV